VAGVPARVVGDAPACDEPSRAMDHLLPDFRIDI
jgi:hypothetical protein